MYFSLSHWYLGSGVVLDCIDSYSLHPYLLFFRVVFGSEAWIKLSVNATDTVIRINLSINGQDKIEMINFPVDGTDTVIRINLPMNGQDKVTRIFLPVNGSDIVI